MPTTGQPDINVTIAAWADIVINIWRNKLVEQKIYDTGELYRSLRYEFYRNAGNDIDKIDFVYNFYGMFHDRGTINLRQREWKGKVFYAQVMRLKEILSQKYSENVINSVQVTMLGESLM